MKLKPKNDPGLIILNHAFDLLDLTIPPDGQILEIGARQEDFCDQVAALYPDAEVYGIDFINSRAPQNWTFIQDDVIGTEKLQSNTFDLVVSISTIEHIGLGFYGDPVDPDGDTRTCENALKWLRPGGRFYFDVPYNLMYYETAALRCYTKLALQKRLIVDGFRECGRFYTHKDPWTNEVIPEPTKLVNKYYFVAILLEKHLTERIK